MLKIELLELDNNAVLNCTMLCYMLHYGELHFTMLCYIMLYYMLIIKLYYATRCYTVLKLSYITLCCTILYSTKL